MGGLGLSTIPRVRDISPEDRRMLIIGLTGGIASGKTTVSDMFAALGVPVIDTDVLAREVVEPGQPGLQAVVDTFGEQVLDADGRLDRATLRRRVFGDPAERRRLEAILHPLIRERMHAAVARLDAPYVIVVIPLLLESGLQETVSRILVVDVPEEVQRRRLLQRDGGSSAEVDAILAAQVSRERRQQAADDILCNNGGLDALQQDVASLHARYTAMAAEAAPGRDGKGAGVS